MSVLEFIAAVKWPVTVLILAATALIALRRSPASRRSLADWIQTRNLRLSVAGQELEATLADAQSNMSVAASGDGELGAAVREAIDTGFIPAADLDLSKYPPAAAEDLGMLRREAVERVMRSSARWGFDMAALGLSDLPELDVQWHGDGQPEITFRHHPPDMLQRTLAAVNDEARLLRPRGPADVRRDQALLREYRQSVFRGVGTRMGPPSPPPEATNRQASERQGGHEDS